MFEIGKDYRFVMLESGESPDGSLGNFETATVYEVAEVSGTLVRCLGPDWSKTPDYLLPGHMDRTAPRDVTIINTASQFFVRAELQN